MTNRSIENKYKCYCDSLETINLKISFFYPMFDKQINFKYSWV